MARKSVRLETTQSLVNVAHKSVYFGWTKTDIAR